MTVQHLARYLRVTWLVGADQPELPGTVEKQKRTEADNQQSVGVGAEGHGENC